MQLIAGCLGGPDAGGPRTRGASEVNRNGFHQRRLAEEVAAAAAVGFDGVAIFEKMTC